jgi:hypothetical protein
VAQNPPLVYRPAPDRAPSPDGRPPTAVLALVALGRHSLATGPTVVVVLNGIVMAGSDEALVAWGR